MFLSVTVTENCKLLVPPTAAVDPVKERGQVTTPAGEIAAVPQVAVTPVGSPLTICGLVRAAVVLTPPTGVAITLSVVEPIDSIENVVALTEALTPPA